MTLGTFTAWLAVCALLRVWQKIRRNRIPGPYSGLSASRLIELAQQEHALYMMAVRHYASNTHKLQIQYLNPSVAVHALTYNEIMNELDKVDPYKSGKKRARFE